MGVSDIKTAASVIIGVISAFSKRMIGIRCCIIRRFPGVRGDPQVWEEGSGS